MLATSATASSKIEIDANVTGSCARIPNRKLLNNRVNVNFDLLVK